MTDAGSHTGGRSPVICRPNAIAIAESKLHSSPDFDNVEAAGPRLSPACRLTHRLLDTVIGCAIALVANYLFWPRDSKRGRRSRRRTTRPADREYPALTGRPGTQHFGDGVLFGPSQRHRWAIWSVSLNHLRFIRCRSVRGT